jgi:outer membrane protein assembly factor BamD
MSIRAFSAATIGFLLVLQGACSSAPPYQGLSTDQIFERGVAAFESGDWDESIRAFERLIFADPTYNRLAEARMHLAQSYFNKEEYITAIAEFTRILDRHPGHALAPEASLGICQSFAELSPIVERDQGYTLQAVTACENVVLDFGGQEVSLEAEDLRNQMVEKLATKEFNTGDHYYRRKYFDSGIIYFNRVLEEYPDSQIVARALLRLYQSYVEIGWETEAEETRDRLLAEFPESDAAKEIRANGGDPPDSNPPTAPDTLTAPDTSRVGVPEGG